MIKKMTLLFQLIISSSLLFAQDTIISSGHSRLQKFEKKNETVRIAFYNVENLFDIYDDPFKNDDEFLPNSSKAWNESKYRDKLDNIYKTLTAVGGWGLPAIVGFCEIENRYVLNELVSKTPLVKAGYSIIHEESPDRRGIDVGLIYQPKKFRPLSHRAVPLVFPFDTATKTRDILYVKGLVFKKDTLHIFVNHWPSRSGGVAASEPKRVFAAKTIKHIVDSICMRNPSSNIIIMGDFNDEPGDKSIMEALLAKPKIENLSACDLFNTSYIFYEANKGTEKYKEHWAVLDQIIVSAPLVTRKSGLVVPNAVSYIFDADWLLEEDTKYMGIMPFRTYAGPKYLGGFSDHLPVFIDLIKIR
ncbi:MAG: endonuclease [Candidatus Competibacteraceae bacterium]|nr:endonuclease [Candidatus Competibacteraceae bacterium]